MGRIIPHPLCGDAQQIAQHINDRPTAAAAVAAAEHDYQVYVR